MQDNTIFQMTSQPEGEAKQVSEQDKIVPLERMLQLPPPLFRTVLGFFSARKLSQMQRVSKGFLKHANGCGHEINFMPERYAELDEKTSQYIDLTFEQRICLFSREQERFCDNLSLDKTPSYIAACSLFIATRAAILGGWVSLKGAIEQIPLLVEGNAEDLLVSPLPLAKAWIRYLKPWQVLTLQRTDPFSYWRELDRNILHVLIDDPTWTVDFLRGLKPYQIRGLQLGFSLDAVQSDWFSPMHVEAVYAFHHTVFEKKSAEEIRDYAYSLYHASKEETLRTMYLCRNVRFRPEAGREEWRRVHAQFLETGGIVPSPVLICLVQEGYIALVYEIQKYFTAEEWKQLISEVHAWGLLKRNLLYYAAQKGFPILRAMLAPLSPAVQQECLLMPTGEEKGYTSLHAICVHRCTSAFVALFVSFQGTEQKKYLGELFFEYVSGYMNPKLTRLVQRCFDQEAWNSKMAAYLQKGKRGYLLCSNNPTLIAMLKAACTPVEWGKVLLNEAAGTTPVHHAVIQGKRDILALLLEGLSPEACQKCITKPLGSGAVFGYWKHTPLVIAVLEEKTALLQTLRIACGFLEESAWQTFVHNDMQWFCEHGYGVRGCLPMKIREMGPEKYAAVLSSALSCPLPGEQEEKAAELCVPRF